MPTFIAVKSGTFSKSLTLVPLAEASVGRDYVRVDRAKSEVKKAPSYDTDVELTLDDEAEHVQALRARVHARRRGRAPPREALTTYSSPRQRGGDGGHPYKTRMIMRRPPADPARFNGTLTVEWYGVDRLKTWSPARYGDLSLTAPNTDPAGGALDARGDVLGLGRVLADGAGAARRRAPEPGRQARDRQRRVAVRRAADHLLQLDRPAAPRGRRHRLLRPRRALARGLADEGDQRRDRVRQPQRRPTYPDSAELPALGGRRDLAREPARHALRRRHHRARQGPARAGDADRS